jgi:hypothetical protein
MRSSLLSILIFAATVTSAQQAEIVLRNGVVWTGDDQHPRAEAVAVRDGLIAAVGSSANISRWVGSMTRVIDLHGKLLIPGFIDDHTHFMSGGFQMQNVDLRQAKSVQEFGELIGQRARKFPTRWITGGDWDHDAWEGGQLPTKEQIDALTPTTPVFVNRYDGHMALANSYTLRLAGITKETKDPPGGSIVRDPKTGEPTGILKDEAMSMVFRIVPDPTEQEMIEAAKLALAEARKLGVTSIQDVSSAADVAVYRKLQEHGQLTARMTCRLPISMVEELIKQGLKVHTGDAWVRTGSLKAFADGSLGSSTALFFEPYVSDPGTRGLATDIVLDGRLERWALMADRAGIQLSIHAIGDSANSLVLDLFEKIVKSNPAWDRRFRIEHAQHIRPRDFERFARLGVIASVQPYHAVDDGRWAEGRIGAERCKTTYPFRSFLDYKVSLSFGSDWTVAPLDPLLGIHAAVTRQTNDGKNPGGWYPEQKIRVEDALKAYTLTNAYAAFEEKEKGSIVAGKFADLVVLSENILALPPDGIRDVKVDLTMVGGTVVYER